MKITNIGKKIAISLVASMVLSGSVEASNIQDIQDIKNQISLTTKKLDTSKYGELSKYKIGNISLEDYVQTKYKDNTMSNLINKSIDKFQKMKLNNKQENSIQKRLKDTTNRLINVNKVAVEDSTTFTSILVDNALGAYDAIKTAPTLAKYEAKFLLPGADKIVKTIKTTKKIISGADKVNASIEAMQFTNALAKVIEPFFKKKISNMGSNDATSIADGLSSLKLSLDKLTHNKESFTGKSAKNLLAIQSLIKSIDDGIRGDKIQKNLTNMENDGLLSKRAKTLINAKLSNDAIKNAAETFTKAIEVASIIGIKNQALNDMSGVVGDMKTIAEVFINSGDRITERAFSDVVKARKEHRKQIGGIVTQISEITNRIEYYEPKNKEKNQKTLTKLKIKDKQINKKIAKINKLKEALDKKEQLKSKKEQATSDTRYSLYQANRDRKELENNDTARKQRLIKKAKIIIARSSNGKWSGLSSADKKKLGMIGTVLGIGKNRTYASVKLFKTVDNYNFKQTNSDKVDAEKQVNFYTKLFIKQKGEFYDLTREVESLKKRLEREQSNLNHLERDKINLVSNINDTIDDYLTDIKVDISKESSTSQSWQGMKMSLLYRDGSVISTSSSLFKDNFSKIADDEILTVSNGSVSKGYFDLHDITMSEEQSTITNAGDYKIMDITNSEGTKVKTVGYYEDYMAWGDWSKPNAGLANDGQVKVCNSTWIAGELTKPSEVPTQGTATYTGSVNGWHQYGSKIIGNVNIVANLGSNSMSGTLNTSYEDGTVFANTHLDSVSINRQTHGVEFKGNLIGVGVSTGKIGGAFYGTNAKAIGGVWSIDKGNGDIANGTFAGKR